MRREAALPDIARIRSTPWDRNAVAPLRDALNILCADALCAENRQRELIDVFFEFRHMTEQPSRLILAGTAADARYKEQIEEYIRELGLQASILIADAVSDAVRLGLYRHADVVVRMGDVSDADTPALEAAAFDVPVLNAATTPPFALPEQRAQLLRLPQESRPQAIAAWLHLLTTEPGVRRHVIASQRTALQLPDERYWQIEGPFDSTYSLAIVNRELACALARRGNDVALRSMEGAGDFEPSPAFLRTNAESARLVERARNAQGAPDAALRFCYPPHVEDMPARIRAIHSYGWEESGFPAEYVAAFNRKLDMVTVLSKAVKKILRDNGVLVPIVVTGAGVDHLLGVVPQAPAIEARGFRFLHISSCFPRKGIDVLLSAWGKAFRDHDDVSLVIKTFPNPHNDVASQVRTWQARDPHYPHVTIIDRDCSNEELVGLYRSCHAFVAPSRGEGLGLPMAEAMLFELPVITTAWGGQRDFCDDSTAWLCDYRFTRSQTHFGQAHSVWADPDIDHLAQLMIDVRRLDPEQRALRLQAARERVMRELTWDRAAQRTEQAIRALDMQPLLRREPKIGWLSTWHKRCGIAAYTSFLTVAIPPDRITVFADHTPDRTIEDGDNIVRCWTVDMEETLDAAYAAIVEHGIDTVVIQYNFGFYSLDTLARLITRLKQAGIGVHCFFHATGDLIWGRRIISLQSIAPALALADRIYVHGVQDLNRLKKIGLVDNVVFFPHGVPQPSAAAPQSLRERHGLQDKKIIAAYGFLLPHKGIRELIHAFGRLVHTDDKLHLLLVNALYPVPVSAEEKDACAALIDELGLAQRITFITDFLPDEECLALLRMADLIVFPYQRTQESSSAAVRMGLAAGRPVVVTPLSIFDDVAEAVHILSGVRIDDIAEGLHRLLIDPATVAAQMEKTARWTSARQWPKLSMRLLNLIDGLANPLEA
jgi:glycosyltransferase involved in cell wall biosynthesis